MFESLVATTAGTSGAGAVEAWSRVESAACARRVAAMAGMLQAAYAIDGSADRDQWCLDNWDAVAAHIGAALRITTTPRPTSCWSPWRCMNGSRWWPRCSPTG